MSTESSFLHRLQAWRDRLLQRLGQLGELALEYPSRMLAISALFYRLLLSTFFSLRGLRFLLRELIRQMYLAGLHGLHVFIFSALMLGFVVIVHATPHLVMLRGEEYLGWLLVTIVVREVGPVWAAFFVLLKAGSAITVQIGTMSVTGETESLALLGIDPYAYLGVPRFWALSLSTVLLYVLCGFAAIGGGYLFSLVFAEIFWTMFWTSFLHSLNWVDVALGFAKCMLFGMLIATVCIYFGFEASEDMEEVALLTSKADLTALVLCASINILLTTAYYL